MQTMTRSEFNQCAGESLLFAQIKAEAYGVTRAQVDLWTAQWCKNSVTSVDAIGVLPLRSRQVTIGNATGVYGNATGVYGNARNPITGQVQTKAQRAEMLPSILRPQAF